MKNKVENNNNTVIIMWLIFILKRSKILNTKTTGFRFSSKVLIGEQIFTLRGVTQYCRFDLFDVNGTNVLNYNRLTGIVSINSSNIVTDYDAFSTPPYELIHDRKVWVMDIKKRNILKNRVLYTIRSAGKEIGSGSRSIVSYHQKFSVELLNNDVFVPLFFSCVSWWNCSFSLRLKWM